jgi:hypothetical protein
MIMETPQAVVVFAAPVNSASRNGSISATMERNTESDDKFIFASYKPLSFQDAMRIIQQSERNIMDIKAHDDLACAIAHNRHMEWEDTEERLARLLVGFQENGCIPAKQSIIHEPVEWFNDFLAESARG